MRYPLFLFFLTIIVYTIFFNNRFAHLDYFVPLATSFLQGRLDVLSQPSYLNELVNWQGKYYVVYPPMPAILLIPFVAIFGNNFYQPILSIILGGLSVALSFIVLSNFFNSRVIALWGSLIYGFGTTFWFHASGGSAWFIAHVCANFFIWLALLVMQKNQSLFLAGLLIGAAYWSRLPAVLVIFFIPLCYSEKFVNIIEEERVADLKRRRTHSGTFFSWKEKQINLRSSLLYLSGVAIFILLNFLYNYLRFGVFHDISYSLLPVFDEPWYQYGLFNIQYLPMHLQEILFVLPKFQTEFPFIIPTLHVMALWVMTPALLLLALVNWREKLNYSAGITALIVAIPGLIHGSNGFAQLGFRFSLDYLPFIIILLTSLLLTKFKNLAKLLFIVSIFITVWIMYVVNVLNIWSM